LCLCVAGLLFALFWFKSCHVERIVMIDGTVPTSSGIIHGQSKGNCRTQNSLNSWIYRHLRYIKNVKRLLNGCKQQEKRKKGLKLPKLEQKDMQNEEYLEKLYQT